MLVIGFYIRFLSEADINFLQEAYLAHFKKCETFMNLSVAADIIYTKDPGHTIKTFMVNGRRVSDGTHTMGRRLFWHIFPIHHFMAFPWRTMVVIISMNYKMYPP